MSLKNKFLRFMLVGISALTFSCSSSSQVIETPTQAPQTRTPRLEDRLDEYQGKIQAELEKQTSQYIAILKENPSEVFDLYSHLEIGALNIAVNSIRSPNSECSQQTETYNLAKAHLEHSRALGSRAPIDYHNQDLINAYACWIDLRVSSSKELLEAVLKTRADYSDFKDILENNFTKEHYEKLMQDHATAIDRIRKAYHGALKIPRLLPNQLPDPVSGLIRAIAEGKIDSISKKTQAFYLSTTGEYFSPPTLSASPIP